MNSLMRRTGSLFLCAFLWTAFGFIFFCHSVSAQVYWSNGDIPQTIGRADLDGSKPNQGWISGCSGPTGVVVDALILLIFADGFESGNTSYWSATVP